MGWEVVAGSLYGPVVGTTTRKLILKLNKSLSQELEKVAPVCPDQTLYLPKFSTNPILLYVCIGPLGQEVLVSRPSPYLSPFAGCYANILFRVTGSEIISDPGGGARFLPTVAMEQEETRKTC